jgi:hypothetical protein
VGVVVNAELIGNGEEQRVRFGGGLVRHQLRNRVHPTIPGPKSRRAIGPRRRFWHLLRMPGPLWTMS